MIGWNGTTFDFAFAHLWMLFTVAVVPGMIRAIINELKGRDDDDD